MSYATAASAPAMNTRAFAVSRVFGANGRASGGRSGASSNLVINRKPASTPVRARLVNDGQQAGNKQPRIIEGGVRHSMRVTRLRDLVEISPDLWAPSEDSGFPAPVAAKGDGLAQAAIFKALLLASQHFRLYSQKTISDDNDGAYGVRFLMGSPRMEGLDDVDRVTKCVCDRDHGLLELVPESGMMVAEIKFPLPALETPADTSAPSDPETLRVERLTALVLALEAQVVDESVVCLMEKGSDDRSTFHGTARHNKYFTGMYARAPDLLHRGTCTSSSPTPGALEASKEMLHRLWEGEEESDVHLMEEVRDRVEALFCGGNGRMVVHPSGTDAETMPLLQAVLESRALARSVPAAARPARFSNPDGSATGRGNVVSLVACAGEVGSGTTEACMGRFFSKAVPLGGNRVAMGQELPALHHLAAMEAVDLVARADGSGDPCSDYDDVVEAAARAALASDPAAVVVLHTVAGSKTGLRLPSPELSTRLRAEFGARVVSVLDACQMRHHPSLIPEWLDQQGPVLMTSSKFFGGPSFGSGVFFPHAAVARMNQHLDVEPPATVAAIAEACASYLTHHDIGDVLPKLHDAMPPGFCNVGVLLRWAAGLHEMETLADATAANGGIAATEVAVRSWVYAVREQATHFQPFLEYVPAEDYGGAWQLGGVNTIVSVRLRAGAGEAFFSTAELKQVYSLMTTDFSEFLMPESSMAERRGGAQRGLTGQPVDVPGGSVLRTVLGAAQLKDLVSGKQQLAPMLEDDRVLLAKLALIASQFRHLVTHAL
uniref:Pyridoxal phosphate-dependent transferase n=1 Tax=Mantoniella antarctica TaxID=81844 RepID=A0A7S0X7B6_9CHLO|mmetsp:Transcript_19243/g.47681  ORF Transcript_19243/g.47681 Transcript_19243/m.47681 type:complete len:775 (+) Transcript_19243:337-2661(+)